MLVDIALDLLEHEGIEALSMRRLAQALSVRASSLYHHFADKAALLEAVADRGLSQLAQEIEQARAQAGPDAPRQIRAMGMAYREWALRRPRLYVLLFGGTPVEAHPSSAAQSVAEPMLVVTARLVGEDRAIAATQAAWAFVHGFVMLELGGQMQQGVPIEGFLLGLELLARGLSDSGQKWPRANAGLVGWS